MDEHLWLSLAIPAAFLVITGIVKSLVKTHITWSNFYLGLDTALAALANGIVNVVDIVRDGIKEEAQYAGNLVEATKADAARQQRFIHTGEYIVAAFVVLLLVMMFHQRWEKFNAAPTDLRVKRGIWLGIVANVIGSSGLLVFIFMRLKGLL